MQPIKIDNQTKQRLLSIFKNDDIFSDYEKIKLLLDKESLTFKELGRIYTLLYDKTKLSTEAISIFIHPGSEIYEEFQEQASKSSQQFKKTMPRHKIDSTSLEDLAQKMYSKLPEMIGICELAKQVETSFDMHYLANHAIESIESIDKYPTNIDPKTHEELKEIQQDLIKLLSQKNTDTFSISSIIKKYNEHAIKIWKDYLSNNPDAHLVHSLSKGPLKGNFKDKLISSSLINNNMLGLFRGNNYGIIIKPNNIVAAYESDTYTINDSTDDKLFIVRTKTYTITTTNRSFLYATNN